MASAIIVVLKVANGVILTPSSGFINADRSRAFYNTFGVRRQSAATTALSIVYTRSDGQ